MAINFFEHSCQETTEKERFGISDLQNGDPAYINHQVVEDEWIAKVDNGKKTKITFTAIDNCIEIYKPNGDMESRCDGMLTHSDNIDFIELKAVRRDWIEVGIAQLKRTIELFGTNHDLTVYTKRRAFLANKKHPQFKYSHKERMQEFKRNSGIRLIIHNKIKV